jgi:hypothetical protein
MTSASASAYRTRFKAEVSKVLKAFVTDGRAAIPGVLREILFTVVPDMLVALPLDTRDRKELILGIIRASFTDLTEVFREDEDVELILLELVPNLLDREAFACGGVPAP